MAPLPARALNRMLRRHVGRVRKCVLDPLQPLSEEAPYLPEEPERARLPQRQLRLVLERPGERGADVVELRLDAIEPDRHVFAREGPLRHGLGELGQPFGMPASQLAGPGLLQLLDGEVANRLEHHEAALPSPEQVVVDQGAEALECHVADALGSLQRAAADEDAQPHERLALLRAEQVEAPVDRGGKRLLARGRVARAARQHVRLAFEPLQDLARREQLRARRGQLDCERQSVELPADASNLGCAGRVELELRVDRLRAGREEAHYIGLDERLERKVGAGDLERRNRVLALGGQPQRRAARGQDPDARGRGEQVADEGCSGEDLLEVVQHEQHPPLAQMLDHALGQVPLALAHVERLGDRRHEQLRARDRREADEQRAVAELGLELVRDRQPDSRLARASRAGEGDEPRALVAEQRADRRELEPAADERRGGHRQRLRRAGRRFRSGEARVLPEDRPLQLLQGRARIEAEILGEGFARVAVDLERVRLAAAAVEREHPLLRGTARDTAPRP